MHILKHRYTSIIILLGLLVISTVQAEESTPQQTTAPVSIGTSASAVPIPAAPLPGATPSIEVQLKQDVARIHAFRYISLSERKLSDFEKLAGELYGKWAILDEQSFFLIAVEVCRTLSSLLFDGEQQYALAQRFALQALEKVERMPAAVQASLIRCTERQNRRDYVQFLKGNVTPEQWAEWRSTKAKIGLHALQRLNQEIDRNFDPDAAENQPAAWVRPPPGSGLGLIGASPKHIKDPKLRAQYEEALRQNRQKGEKVSHQRRLRDFEVRFIPFLEEYLVQVYSRPPHNEAELMQYLGQYEVNAALRERITVKVKEQMKITNKELLEPIIAGGRVDPKALEKALADAKALEEAKVRQDATSVK